MKWVKYIPVYFFMMIFLLSSTGVVVFHTHCNCTGTDQVSLYVSPETCEDNFHRHHTHNAEGNEIPTGKHECHECSNHLHNCGCDSPQVKFFKLKNQLIDEEVKYVLFQPVEISVFINETVKIVPDVITSYNEVSFYIDPPPKFCSSLDFLIPIQQLKIPEIA